MSRRVRRTLHGFSGWAVLIAAAAIAMIGSNLKSSREEAVRVSLRGGHGDDCWEPDLERGTPIYVTDTDLVVLSPVDGETTRVLNAEAVRAIEKLIAEEESKSHTETGS